MPRPLTSAELLAALDEQVARPQLDDPALFECPAPGGQWSEPEAS